MSQAGHPTLNTRSARVVPCQRRRRRLDDAAATAAAADAGDVLVYTCNTHTHTHLTALCPELPGSAGTRKVIPIGILLKQETVSGSGISWTICKSASRSRQITTPAPHHSAFLQAECPSCRPTNSVKALKAFVYTCNCRVNVYDIIHNFISPSYVVAQHK